MCFQPIAQERHQGPARTSEEKKTSVTNELFEPPSALVREEEFAKQLRLARYLAVSSLPPARALEPVIKARAPKQEGSVTKARSKAKAESARQKAGEAELAKERRRAGRVGPHKTPSSASHRGEKQRSSPGR